MMRRDKLRDFLLGIGVLALLVWTGGPLPTESSLKMGIP